MFSSSDYKTAAAVALDSVDPQVQQIGQAWAAEGRRVAKWEEYLADLADVIDPRDPWDKRGYWLLFKLLEDGWTPPEGLF